MPAQTPECGERDTRERGAKSGAAVGASPVAPPRRRRRRARRRREQSRGGRRLERHRVRAGPARVHPAGRAEPEAPRHEQGEGLREVPTRVIGARVMKALEVIDPVAYVRYASVYRQFQEVGEFIEEIESLERRPGVGSKQPDFFVQ